jgi:restriction endonuclease Mrr
MDKSPIDDLFYSLYKFYPNKKGRAFELLVAAAIKIITGKKVDPDKHVKGEYSKTDYQIDGILYDDKGEVMIEAKDYTARDEKVGRDDLQTMQGALTELKFIKGVFASATDFTRPARKYERW